LLVAAALREVLTEDPIVVGGTAEEFWTEDEYAETDLDLCAPLTPADRTRLKSLGFEPEGRHWFHPTVQVAVEFPEPRIEGDESRTHEVKVGPGAARIIGLDDLYLDRLRQATMAEGREGVELKSAVAVAVARYEEMDWEYVAARIRNPEHTDPALAQIMKRLDSRIRRRARQVISEGSAR
jgi:hypothetical protein